MGAPVNSQEPRRRKNPCKPWGSGNLELSPIPIPLAPQELAMNAATSAAAGPILALDLGKYKSVACVHDATSGELRFTSFETTRAELHKLIAREQPAAVIIEACLLAGWVHD